MKFLQQLTNTHVNTFTNWRLLNVIIIRLTFFIHSHHFHFEKSFNWKVLFWAILNYFHNHRIHLGNSQWFLLVPVQILFFFWHSRLSRQKLIRLFELILTVELMSACVFWTSSWVVAFLRCSASYPLLCWVCLAKRRFPHYQLFLHFFPKRYRWIWTWKECRNNQRVDMWSEHGPVWRVNHSHHFLHWEEGWICSFSEKKCRIVGCYTVGSSRSHRLK